MMADTAPLPMAADPRLRWAATAAALLLLAAALWLVALQTARPAARLAVSGTAERVTPQEIHRVLAPELGAPISQLDLVALRAAVKSLPWVADARVERVWPDGLHVRIWERVPVARWGSEALLDVRAEVFSPRIAEMPLGLPQLDGPEGAALEVLQRYLGLAEAIAPSGLELTGLSLDVRGEWIGRIAPGIPLRFGREDPMSRLAVLVGPVRRVISGRLQEVERVDLRYTNGFAVRWRNVADASGVP